MTRYKGLFGLAALVASVALGTFCEAATIRDQAGLFQADVVRKAQAQLDRVERSSGIPIVIETIDAIPGLGKDAPKTERETEINREAVRRDREIHDEGLYILISKRDRVISNVLVRQRHAALVPAAARAKIRDAFVSEFRKNQNYDGGLTKGALVIEETLSAAKAPVRAVHGGVGEPRQSSMMGTFLLIIVGILGVLIVVRILGGLFGRGAGAGYPPMGSGMGAPPGGMPPGGQGYYGGGGGYGGGRGGGFFSGMLGGLGGALAGNWLYDQFSGRHGQTMSSDASNPDVANPDAGGDAIVGGDDDGGQGASWDGGGTPDAGGGWGDSGGGDWGGGGGGGGGDWGGGGGGDFGGGGGGGGDW